MGKDLALSMSLGTWLLHTHSRALPLEVHFKVRKNTPFLLAFASFMQQMFSTYYVQDPREASEDVKMHNPIK